MTTTIIDNGIFEYATVCEKQFETYLDEIGHGKRQYTFIADLSLAEPFGAKAIKDTDRRVTKAWIKNVPAIAEYIMSLNFKCWVWHVQAERADKPEIKDKCAKISELYADLFYSAQERAYKCHEGNEESISYLYHYLD